MQALRPSPQFVTDDGAEQFLETVQGDDSLQRERLLSPRHVAYCGKGRLRGRVVRELSPPPYFCGGAQCYAFQPPCSRA